MITYEGGGADFLGDQSVKVAVHGVMNALRSMRMIPGNPQRPKFRIMASGSTWLRAGEGGLLDMFVSAGSVMREGEVVATISDPATPGMTVDIVAPEDGLIIGAATNPFTAAGMPVGHFLPISKHFALLEEQIDADGHFIVNGSLEEASGVRSTKSTKFRLMASGAEAPWIRNGLLQRSTTAKRNLKKKPPDHWAAKAETAS